MTGEVLQLHRAQREREQRVLGNLAVNCNSLIADGLIEEHDGRFTLTEDGALAALTLLATLHVQTELAGDEEGAAAVFYAMSVAARFEQDLHAATPN